MLACNADTDQTKKSARGLHCPSNVNLKYIGMYSTITLLGRFKHSRINQQAPETPIRPLSKSNKASARHARQNTVNLKSVISKMLAWALSIVYLFDNLRYSTLLDTFKVMHFQPSQLAGTV